MNYTSPQANGFSNTTFPSINITQPVPMNEKISDSFVSLSISKKPAFRISVPDNFFDLDDDEDGNTNDLSIPSTSSPSDSITKISVRNDSNSKTREEKLLSSSMLYRKDEKKAAMLPGEDNGFAFPIASDPSTESQPPPTPAMQTSKLHTQKKTAPKPVASSESKKIKAPTVATNIGDSSSENAGIKVGEEIRSEAIQTTSNTTANESNLVKSEVRKTGDLPKSPAAVSGISTTSSSALFYSEASSISNLSNSSVIPSPNTDSVPSNPKFGNNNSTNTISNNSVLSTAAATLSTTAPTPLFQPLGTSKSNGIEANTFKASSFSVPASTYQDSSFVLPTSSPSISSSSSTTSMASPLFSEKSRTISSPAFPATPIFGFSASTKSIGSSSSLSETASVFGSTNGSTASVFGATEKPSAVSFGANNNNSSQNSSIPTVASDNNSQKPGAISFGSGNGLIFGSQSTQRGRVSQAPTSQFGVFSSSPSFKLSKSTLGGFGNSAFGSASFSPNPFTSSPGVPFSSSLNPLISTSIFGSSSQASSASPIFSSSSASMLGISTLGSAAPFQFGPSSSGSTNSPFTFNSSFPAGSPGFMFGSLAPQQNGMPSFPFGGAQSGSVPFQASGSVDFNLGGSFSSGSGTGCDKSARIIIKVKRGRRGRK